MELGRDPQTEAGISKDRDTGAFLYDTFPGDFVWGTATAAYQIEGAHDIDGCGPSIWDTFSHEKGRILGGDTGDVACDHYHHYLEDIQRIKELGTSHYRLSLSWSRILPDGTPTSLNTAGVAFYQRLLGALVAEGIQPCVTLYHWDLPQALQDKGGWPSPDMADHFMEYARVCFKHFGDKVKMWSTFNEPLVSCFMGYANGRHAPGIADPLGACFPAAHTIIRAHTKAYRLYGEQFRAKQGGQVGIVLVSHWHEPLDPSNPADVAAAERAQQSRLGWFANPIFGNGDYPDIQKELMADLSKKVGLPKSALPEFTPEEIKLNKGSADFFGLNHYSSRMTSAPMKPPSPNEAGFLTNTHDAVDPDWKRAKSAYLYVVPWGIRKMINWVSKTYNRPPIYITENGYSDSGQINDQARIDYYKAYINQILRAIHEEGCPVKGYFAWSLLDNFEWTQGFSEHFGFYHVDFKDPKRKRTPKESSRFYSKLIKDNGFVKQGNL